MRNRFIFVQTVFYCLLNYLKAKKIVDIATNKFKYLRAKFRFLFNLK